jgi:hypothetical protein
MGLLAPARLRRRLHRAGDPALAAYNHQVIRTLVFSLACGCVAAPAQDEPFLLEWKVAKGETVRYASTHATSVGAVKERVVFEYALTPGDGDVAVRIDRVCIKRGQIDYDSSKEGPIPPDVQGRLMAAQVGKSYRLPMSAGGEFKAVTDLDQFAEAVAKSMGGNEEYNRSLVFSVRNAEQLRHEMQSTFPALAGKAIAVGATWESADAWKLADVGSIASKVVCRLKEVKGGEAHVAESTTFSKTQGPGELKEGKRTAEWVWDLAGGRLKSCKGTTTLSFVANGQAKTLSIEFSTAMIEK